MNWKAVEGDTYYAGRHLEAEARGDDDPEKWRKYADIKIRKGSHALGIHGCLNAACLADGRGDTGAAVAAYLEAVDTAMGAGYRELAVILTYRLCELHERAQDWDAAIVAYEHLGGFCEQQEAYFLAADAYEHAAEMMVKAGREVSDYLKPIELWERNARYWEEEGHDHDAVWSRNHILLYRKLFGVAE